jgi:hypothetical protein
LQKRKKKKNVDPGNPQWDKQGFAELRTPINAGNPHASHRTWGVSSLHTTTHSYFNDPNPYHCVSPHLTLEPKHGVGMFWDQREPINIIDR